MINYAELTKQLKEQDEHIITKLAIYYELSSLIGIEELSPENINEMVEYLHNIYYSNDDLDYLYPKVAGAALEVCNYDVQKLFMSIQENGDKLEEEILEALY